MSSQQGEPAVTVGEVPSGIRRKPSKKAMIIIALAFGIIGGVILWRSFAATAVIASIEAEQMVLPPRASIITDTSASSGKAIRMTQNGTVSSTVNLPSSSTSLAITVRSIKCKGSYAGFTLNIDDKDVLSSTAGTGSWRAYSASLPLASGSHTVKVVSRNVSQQNSCNRSLYLDVATFSGNTTSTPVPSAPVVSFSASPTSLTAGQSSTLTWNSTNATGCTASGAWSGSKPTSGSASTGALNASATYTLSCTGSGGSDSKSVTVAVGNAPTSGGSVYWGSWIDGDTYSSGGSDAPWGSTTWDTFENHTGKQVSILHYGQPPMWEQIFYPGVGNLVTNRGAIPMMDMSSKEVPLTDIINGNYDAKIGEWATAVKTWGKPFFFRWNWEMNGTWYSWGVQAQQNPANFTAAWKHIHDIVTSRGATNVTWVWCPNTVHPGSTPLSSLYPGDAYVDWTCIDGYNKGPLNGDIWRNFYGLFQPTYSELLRIAPSKPIMIGETASNENGGSKAAWITDALQTQLPTNFPRVKAFVWFNWPIYEGGVTQQWPIESSASAQSAFRTGIGLPYYAGNNYGNLPPLTKVQPLP